MQDGEIREGNQVRDKKRARLRYKGRIEMELNNVQKSVRLLTEPGEREIGMVDLDFTSVNKYQVTVAKEKNKTKHYFTTS